MNLTLIAIACGVIALIYGIFTSSQVLGASAGNQRMQEVSGRANAESVIELIATDDDLAQFRLRPLTGKKHQLRVHLAALGFPIVNDRLYPDNAFVPHSNRADDFAKPLKLLARSVTFTDPVTGEERFFESERRLSIADCRFEDEGNGSDSD